VLDSGGTLFRGGSLATSENPKQGALIAAAMNLMGYDAMALGARDLEAPLTTVQARFEEAEFPILSTNVTPGRTLPNVQPFVLREAGGHTIAVIGVTPSAAAERLAELGLAPMSPDPIAVVKRAVKRASRRADVIVLLSTLSRDAVEALVLEVPGIDAIIGLDRGAELKPITVPGAEGEVVLHTAWNRGEYLGWLTLNLDAEGQVTGFDGHAIALTDQFVQHPEIVGLIRDYAKNP
jgi:2',3'-cyclic-nucleotide 2'-phosphodiesterase (5'-nucleotidase family)